MTKTLREELYHLIYDEYIQRQPDMWAKMTSEEWTRFFLPFIESKVKEGEERGRDGMKHECLKCIPGEQPSEPHIVDFNSGWNEANDITRTAIQSLK